MAVCSRSETLMVDGYQAGVACRSVCVREAVRVESAYVSRPHVRARERAREGRARLHVYVHARARGRGRGQERCFWLLGVTPSMLQG